MGLDMYLRKHVYIGGKFEHRNARGVVEIDLDVPEEHFKFDPKDISEIVLEVGYWRKANQIHKWFVDNCQNGVDECQLTYVPFEKLQELKGLCERALAENDHSLLPTQGGFFFGSTEIDDYYWDDLRDTIKIIEPLKDDHCYYYHSSW